MAFWYKPYSSHPHFYPSTKDEDGQPVRDTVSGEEQFRVCPHGIEIFKTKRVMKRMLDVGEGPQGLPPLAAFATA
eukprot:6015903-Pleurochrysis_carterae.AAC.1